MAGDEAKSTNGNPVITVACVLKSGGIYDTSWVERLKEGVKKYLPLDHMFVCLSDVPTTAITIPLKHNWPGWWSKIELFKLDGPVLYFDLDTIITGDLSDIAVQQGEFTALRDFYREDGLGSGMMAWNASMQKLYDLFLQNPTGIMDRYRGRGDQRFIEDNIVHWARWQDKLPGQVVSYKVHVKENKMAPANARVVCFHGDPKPDKIAWNLAA
jgi:hypothetical protein